VQKQDFSDFEVIVIDDGSTDQTEDIVKEFTNDVRFYYQRQVNAERGAARNSGAALSKGLFLNFFDSDDVMYPNHLSSASDFIKNHADTKFFHTGYSIVNEAGKVLTEEMGVVNDPENRLIATNYLGCNSVFVRRDLFMQNQFNPDRRLASSEDWELWLRLISREPLERCSKITLQMSDHPGRSLLTISPERIVERDMVLLSSLLSDSMFTKKFKNKLSLFKADRFTFFALVFSIAKGKQMAALHYLIMALLCTPGVLTRKRFWASLRHAVRAILLDFFK
jgi:glycosyltransferase involved in cell wall biosynthesis